MIDVTNEVLRDYGCSRARSQTLQRPTPAKKIEGSLVATWATLLDPRTDLTMGFISGPLLYSRFFETRPKAFQRDVIRLLKGGYLIVIRMNSGDGRPDPNSNAAKESPFSSFWYQLSANPEKPVSLADAGVSLDLGIQKGPQP